MQDYCVNPVYIPQVVKPNILIVLDVSGSMQFPTNLPCNFSGYSNYVAQCGSSSSGADYNPSQNYYGLFDRDSCYTYSSGVFSINPSCSCSDRIGTSTCISGNLLNWITTTRIDAVRKALTGGRTRTGTTDILESEGATYIYRDMNLKCEFSVSASVTSERRLTVKNYNGTCPLGNGVISSANIRIRVNDPSGLKGILQDFSDMAVFELMVFSTGSGSYDREGEMRAGKTPPGPLSSFINALNNEVPYWGTPTGEALYEAYDFFNQKNNYSYEANTNYIKRGDPNRDPYYDSSWPITCRRGFVLLISDGVYNGNVDPVRPAKMMRTSDVREDLKGKQAVTTYVIYVPGDVGSDDRIRGRNSLITTAIFGGFDDLDRNGWPYPFTDFPSDSRNVNYPLSRCNPSGTWDDLCREWDRTRTGLPYNYFEVQDISRFENAVRSSLESMLEKVYSGTAASVLASQEGVGAELVQAIFYPKRVSGTYEMEWTGELHGLFYQVDPYLQMSSIREDTDGNRVLNTVSDLITEFYFDEMNQDVMVRKMRDTNGDGVPDQPVGATGIEGLRSTFRAGENLCLSQPSSRRIYTQVSGTLLPFTVENASQLMNLLQASSPDEASTIIRYVRGEDIQGTRTRTFSVSGTGCVWKLSDVIDSTPFLLSSIPVNSYHMDPPAGYSDMTYREFVSSPSYTQRGMVFFGANDGMLHAVRTGRLLFEWEGKTKYDIARIDGNPGGESWAFIPRNALPYLKYLMDPSYCHIYYVDLPALAVDASTGGPPDGDVSPSSWRTILIGGMGSGGATAEPGSPCVDCIRSPIQDAGYSSYFALDVTDPENPVFLWEFSHPELGLALSGPQVIRIGDPSKNGRWFVVFGSGPTGPVDIATRSFLGRSNQNLKIFILDLKTGRLVRKIDTGKSSAFSSAIYQTSIDIERGTPGVPGRMSDDVFYIGYVQGTSGGVLRVITGDNPDPLNWTVSDLISGVGPVSSSPAKLLDRKNGNLWVFFGEGRYFFKSDDPSTRRRILGVKDPCYTGGDIQRGCTSSVSLSSLSDATTSPPQEAPQGWYIWLDPESTDYMAERVISNPSALPNGVVLFPTIAPSEDICSFGANTYLWGVRYDTGGAASYGQLKGETLIQVSTGELKKVVLESAFTEKGGRRTGAIVGMPPKSRAMIVFSRPKPEKRIIHYERR
jgi:type IV pilus assembly protein PilY1